MLAPIDPVRFLEIATAYQVLPEGFWVLLSIVVAFYFGGRMQVKAQDMRVAGNAVSAARDMVAMRRSFRELVREDEPPTEQAYQRAMSDAGTPLPNTVIMEWNRRRAAGAQSGNG